MLLGPYIQLESKSELFSGEQEKGNNGEPVIWDRRWKNERTLYSRGDKYGKRKEIK